MSGYAEELAEIRKAVPEESFYSVQNNLIICDFRPTRAKQLRVELHFLENYPAGNDCLGIFLTSRVISENALGELKKHLLEGMAGAPNQMRALYILSKVHTMMNSHRFISCWDEIHKIKDIFEGKVKLNPTDGTVRLKLKAKKYVATLTITVPVDYPDTSPVFKLTECNLDERLCEVDGKLIHSYF
jgi:hypothetical protein